MRRECFLKTLIHFLEKKEILPWLLSYQRTRGMGEMPRLTLLAASELLKDSVNESMVTSVRLTLFFRDLWKKGEIYLSSSCLLSYL